MRRLRILAVLAVSASIAVSAWLVIDAESDPSPVVSEERFPRDDEQSQQGQQQAEPEPRPDGADEADQADQAEQAEGAGQQRSEASPASQGQSSDSADQPSQQEATDASEPQEQQGAPSAASDADLPERTLVEAINLDRPLQAGAAWSPDRHVIEAGDTLSGIADAYDVDVGRLARFNDIKADDLLSVGEALRIPSPRVYVPLQAPPGPSDYSGGGLVWGTITEEETNVVHTAIVNFTDHRAGLSFVPDLVIGCINNRLVAEVALPPGQAERITDDVRVFWRIDRGPLRTSRWTVIGGVLSAPDPQAFVDSLRDALDLRLYTATSDDRITFYWYPSVGRMVQTPVQANIDNCGH